MKSLTLSHFIKVFSSYNIRTSISQPIEKQQLTLFTIVESFLASSIMLPSKTPEGTLSLNPAMYCDNEYIEPCKGCCLLTPSWGCYPKTPIEIIWVETTLNKRLSLIRIHITTLGIEWYPFRQIQRPYLFQMLNIALSTTCILLS